MPALILSGSRMALVSLVSYGVNVGLFALLTKTASWEPEISAATAMAVVMSMNFLACRYFIFAASDGSVVRQLVFFSAGTLVFRALELGALSAICRLTAMDSVLAYPLVLAASFVGKLVFFGKSVFGRP